MLLQSFNLSRKTLRGIYEERHRKRIIYQLVTQLYNQIDWFCKYIRSKQ